MRNRNIFNTIRLNTTLRSNIFRIYTTKKSITFKKLDEIDSNYYQILGVSYDADYETIKKKYYILAKKYHPDLNPDKEAIENFKRIKKAYEILGDPNLRIAYDLENNLTDINESEKRRESDERYTNKYGKRIMRGPRTIKNFYFDKWSNFKTPQWSNFKTGMDFKAEYMHRGDEENLDESHSTSRIKSFIFRYRIVWYILFLISFDLIILYDNWGIYNTYVMFKNTFFINKNFYK